MNREVCTQITCKGERKWNSVLCLFVCVLNGMGRSMCVATPTTTTNARTSKNWNRKLKVKSKSLCNGIAGNWKCHFVLVGRRQANDFGRVESGWLQMRDDTNDNCSCQRLLEKGKSSLVCVCVCLCRRLNKRVANRKTCLRFAKNGAETKKTCFSI